VQDQRFLIIYHGENQAEISINRNWDPSVEGKAVPLNIDKRFIVLNSFVNSSFEGSLLYLRTTVNRYTYVN